MSSVHNVAGACAFVDFTMGGCVLGNFDRLYKLFTFLCMLLVDDNVNMYQACSINNVNSYKYMYLLALFVIKPAD